MSDLTFTFTTLTDPDDTGAQLTPLGINDDGVVIGFFGSAGSHPGFIDNNGSFSTVVDSLAGGGGYTYLQAINSADEVTGYYYNPSSQAYAGFVEENGTITNFTEQSSEAYGINDSGEVVGYEGSDAFTYLNGTFTTFKDSTGQRPVAFAVNDSGVIVGQVDVADSTEGFIDNNGTFTNFSDPIAAAGMSPATIPKAINDAGVVVGDYSTYDIDNNFEGFIYNDGTFTNLADPSAGSGGYTYVDGINSSDQVVGDYYNGKTYEGFVYNDGTYINIIDPSQGAGGSTELTGINDSGDVTGYYTSGGKTFGFVADATVSSQPGDLLVSSGVTVDEGSTASGLVVSRGETLTVNAGDTVSGVRVLAGGTEIVISGGVAYNDVISSGGTALVQSGAVASGDVISGGVLSVTDAAVVDTQVASGGQLVVGDPSTASATVVSGGGTYTVSGNGADFSGTVQSGGTVIAVSGGVLSGTSILSGGVALVSSGGTAADVVVQRGGAETVVSGGALYGATIAGGSVSLLTGAASSGTIDFDGVAGTLTVSGAFPPNDVLTGFTAGFADNILFEGVPFSGATVSFSGGEITIASGGSSFMVADPTGIEGTPFSILDVDGFADLVPCFAAGTRILTTGGEVAVEDLRVGDRVVTVRDGGGPTARIIWTGRRTLNIARHADPAAVRPVRIHAGAFGAGIPARDVRLSPHHAVYVEGELFEAIALVNGITIVQEQTTRAVAYHHIELEQHDIMLAEGLPTESFLDTGNRDMFETEDGALRLHPTWRTPPRAATCVPLHREGAKVEQARARLLALAQSAARTPHAPSTGTMY